MTWLAFFHGTQNNVAECIVCDLISCLQNPYRIAFEGWKKKFPALIRRGIFKSFPISNYIYPITNRDSERRGVLVSLQNKMLYLFRSSYRPSSRANKSGWVFIQGFFLLPSS